MVISISRCAMAHLITNILWSICSLWRKNTFKWPQIVNSPWPTATIWHHWYWLLLVQAKAYCLMAPNHYLNRYWFIISKVHLHQLREISQELPQPSIIKISLKITYLKLNWNLSGDNELTSPPQCSLIGWLDRKWLAGSPSHNALQSWSNQETKATDK